jgi:hypothetical protein
MNIGRPVFSQVIEACLRAVSSKLYHMGIRGKVSRSTLAYANEKPDFIDCSVSINSG